MSLVWMLVCWRRRGSKTNQLIAIAYYDSPAKAMADYPRKSWRKVDARLWTTRANKNGYLFLYGYELNKPIVDAKRGVR